jgi:2-polyprenyl-3-methyl-5-hydroxy-6-metoxy-1,4-benzoquinol methylase
MIECINCDSSNVQKIYSLDNFSHFNVPISKTITDDLLSRFNLNDINKSLDIGHCKNCNHFFLIDLPNNELLKILYNKCYNVPHPLLKECVPFREDYFIEYFSDIVNKNNFNTTGTVIEIGGGDQYVLYKLNEQGYIVHGCDPDYKASLIAQDHDVEVNVAEFNYEYYKNKDITFDYVILRNLIEHIFNPEQFINEVTYILNDNAKIFIEVPDVEHFLVNGILDTFHFQHIHYFSEHSIKLLLEKTKYNIVDYKTHLGNIYICATKDEVQQSNENNIIFDDKIINNFLGLLSKNKKHLTELISLQISLNKKIVFWGAGGMLYMLLKYLNIEDNNNILIVDKNSKKHDLKFMQINHKINAIETLKQLDYEYIIISSMFFTEIIKDIKNINYLSGKKIIYFDPDTKELI